MKTLFLLTSIFAFSAHADTIVTATVKAVGCVDSELIQVIAVKKDISDQFMYQVGVPHGGTADFNFIPGDYRLEAISDKGCFGKIDFAIKDEKQVQLALELKP